MNFDVPAGGVTQPFTQVGDAGPLVAGGSAGSAGGVGEAVGVDDSGGAIVDVSVGSGALEKTSEPAPVPPLP